MIGQVPLQRLLRTLAAASILTLAAGCGNSGVTERPGSNNSPASPATQEDICACSPSQPTSADFRHSAKHVGLPGDAGQPITVEGILAWEHGPEPAFDSARTGRELQMFRVERAYLQLAWVNGGDCDLHLEISATPDKNAPRVIVETPIESGYCGARRELALALEPRGFKLNKNSGELSNPVPVSVRGLAFRDYSHVRGSGKERTPWELHPAVVTVLP